MSSMLFFTMGAGNRGDGGKVCVSGSWSLVIPFFCRFFLYNDVK